MTMPPQRQRGFALMTALFVVVVLGMLAVFMLRLSVLQQTTVTYAVQGLRAYYAARSGIEWGVHQALTAPGSCMNPYPGFNVGVYTVTVRCTPDGPGDGASPVPGTYTEGGPPYQVYRISAVAEYDGYGSSDYIRREIETTVTNAP